ncbi:Putative FAD-binding domain, FAD/NAD(P)-binding domain superfamily [Septoria linicola]|uniref:FAD-binding domain, FAD/NAD(P)-binding domain superfamily n=1 Tax=Septoria linicola TaxID=215465 RepID=A0A9Q9EEJ6_9PEZI|nr:putative FAD-binding domain, FAD/NAD(P)-binding domain superfamily [Septoria linicola]USW47940.1 Putative FAD-binding domain, FAD/NAD(P)-binding domain superfamily [Septoria linicola]
MAARNRRVLVNGAGPAGAVTAFWLAKAGFGVLVTERSTSKPYGQGIDITGRAVDVVQRMGLEQRIRANTTGEEGLGLADDVGENVAPPLGTAPVEGGTASVSQEIEIMRSELTKIFVDAAETMSNVTFRYGVTVDEIHQNEKSITAVLSDSSKPQEFDAIIGADGLGSRVRKLTFDSETDRECTYPTNTYVAFFSIPGDPANDPPVGKFQHGNKGRGILMRPIDKKGTRRSCYLMSWTENEHLAQVARSGSSDEQKAILDKLFREFQGPLGARSVEGMYKADDFYFTRIVQVKLDKWHSGRAALVGDAGYSPSPLTGQGTTLAIIGAYVLAGEMSKNPDDLETAFTSYRDILQRFVKESQAIPLGGRAPKLALPQTDWGVWILRSFFWLISVTRIWKLFNFGNETVKFELPRYEFDGK